jgi:hypothetical protein
MILKTYTKDVIETIRQLNAVVNHTDAEKSRENGAGR